MKCAPRNEDHHSKRSDLRCGDKPGHAQLNTVIAGYLQEQKGCGGKQESRSRNRSDQAGVGVVTEREVNARWSLHSAQDKGRTSTAHVNPQLGIRLALLGELFTTVDYLPREAIAALVKNLPK